MDKIRLKAVKNILVWCAENHSDDFCIFVRFSGHVANVEVGIHSGGWGSERKIFTGDGYFDGANYYVGDIDKMYKGMLAFKTEHDLWFSEGNLKKQKEINRLKRIESLKKQLESLDA